MTRERKTKRIIFAFIALLLLIVTIIGGREILPAFAATTETNVLSDLQKDSSFKASYYPDNAKDYKIKVIQIAEGVEGELYLYTYQPCQKTKYLIATQINMSLTDKLGGIVDEDTELTDSDKPKLYDLTLLNSVGVFVKYKVKDFTVSKEATRFYNIVSIYRAFDSKIDKPNDNDNSTNSVYFTIGKQFKAETVNGEVKYYCKNVDVVEIKNPYVDYVSYGQQSGWDFIFGVTNWTDIHYIAFSTDKKIDTLMEADVTYTTQTYHYTGKDNKGYTYGEKSKPQYLTLTGKEQIGITGFEKYNWDSIYRTEDFIKTVDLKGAAKTEVEKSEFVLVFLKTSFKEQEQWSLMQGHYKILDGVKVANVAILRLMFETEGIVYNLGALMNQQEGDGIAGNHDPDKLGKSLIERIIEFFENLFNKLKGLTWWQWLLIGLGAILVIGLIFSLVYFGIKAVLKCIFKILWWLLTLPFKIIKAISNKRKRKYDKGDKND